MRSADHAMRETADEKKRRRRKYPATAESTGKHLVMTELLRRGFEAELAGASYEKHDVLVRFFVVKNSDLAGQFRQPPTWKAFGFIDGESVEKYEDNWDILK